MSKLKETMQKYSQPDFVIKSNHNTMVSRYKYQLKVFMQKIFNKR